jgi:hypothetical protein
MTEAESQTFKYCGVVIEVWRREDKCAARCPFCNFTSEVETGFFPKFSMKLAAQWVNLHLESFHPALLDQARA